MLTKTSIDCDLVHELLLVIYNLAVRKTTVKGVDTETYGIINAVVMN